MASTPDLLSAEGSGAEPSASAEVYCAGDLSIEVGGLLGGAFVTGEIARATTDGGHVAPILDTLWARDNLRAQVDRGYRAVHEVATAAKEIIGRFYGRPSAHSYFYGLSDGGREALMEAQRYPGDFAGIVADAPAFLSSTLNGILQPWVASANLDEHGGYMLTPEKVRVLHAAVIAACDQLDGLADHLIEDPRACTFNPSTVECPGATDRADCLTHAQVEVARTLYEPPHDGAGHVLYPGAMPYGSEAAWDFEITAARACRPWRRASVVFDVISLRTWTRHRACGAGASTLQKCAPSGSARAPSLMQPIRISVRFRRDPASSS